MMEYLPVFVKVTGPKDIRDLIDQLKNEIMETKAVLEKIRSLSDEESSKVSEWKSNLAFINQQIDDIGTTLLEPERV